MEKRYQVFVSSTYEDLRAERQEIMQALLELDCIPAGMELFPAADEDQWTLIKQVIDDCDYYIVVVAGRYGSEGSDGISYTRMEYEYAVEQGKPVIGFLHKDPQKIPSGKTENDKEKQEKLEEFRSVIKRKVVKYWDTPQELGSVVSRSLIKLIKTNPAVGWVRADNVPSESAAEEILSLKRTIESLEKELAETTAPAFVPISELSQGNDTLRLAFSFDERNYNSYRWESYRDTCTVTWNDVFSKISPLMIDEASERVMRGEISNYLEEIRRNELEEIIRKLDDESEEIIRFDLSNVVVEKQAFETIKIQFVALGLIKKSVRSRSVKDKMTYWSLTPKGEQLMMQLRAIKKPGVQPVKPKIKPDDGGFKREAK